jgi:hypothetical protein
MKPVDPVRALIAAFDRANLVALGERHWAREDAEFCQRLVQDRTFAEKVNDIVIEFGNPLYQTALSRFVNGEEVPPSELRRVWQDTTQPGTWDSPVYEEFLVAVRAVNAKLPLRRRLRVLAGDYPINWSAVSGPGELPDLDARDRSAADVIRREVLSRHRKALVLFGSAHLYRNRPGTLVELLKEDPRARWFVVVPVGGPGLPTGITANQGSSTRPVFIGLADSGPGDLNAVDVLEREGRRIKVVDGKPAFVDGTPVFIPVFEAGIQVRQLVDALLFFGSAPPEFVQPPASLYGATEYGRETERRRKMVMPR